MGHKFKVQILLVRCLRALQRSKFVQSIVQQFGLTRLAVLVIARVNSLEASKNPAVSINFLRQKLPSKLAWDSARRDAKENAQENRKQKNLSIPADIRGEAKLTVIVSLYNSDKYLSAFVETLLSQTILSQIEVVVVSVAPTDLVRNQLSDWFGPFPNIKIIEVPEVIGIYKAWNLAIRNSSSPFITNMNVDDQRFESSLEIQLYELAESECSVLYQDVYFSFEPNLSWEEIERIGFKSNFPDVTLRELARGYNYPHNAPMWRRSLHEEVGYFDENFKSAGDHDFWIRVAISGNRFLKSKSMHVAYFINPEGLSTSNETSGTSEGAQLLRNYRRFAR